MTIETVLENLATHEAKSQARYEDLTAKLKGNTMADPVNIFDGGSGMGTGLGAGLLGGVLGGALLGNRGLLGGGVGVGGVEGIVTPTMLTAALNQVQDNTNAATAASERLNMARFDADSQRDIQAAIQSTAAATQLAFAVGNAALGVEIAKGQGEINTQVALTTGNLGTQNALNAAAIQTLVQKTAGDLGVQAALGAAATQAAVAASGTANALAFKDVAIQAAQNTYALANAIKADGDMTRGLIVAQNDAMLNRLLTTAQNEIIELRGDREGNRRSRETEVNVTQSVTQSQAQAQLQAQQQQQAVFNAQIWGCLQNLQQATATNQSLIIGNTGAVVGGPQTANPTNVRA